MTDALAVALVALGAVLVWRAYSTRPPHLALVLLLCASCSPLPAAIKASNAAAVSLRETGAQLEQRRKAEQMEAARAVEGDRHDPAVKAAQRAAVSRVGLRYVDAFDALRVARFAWLRVVGLIKLLRDNPDLVEASTVTEALRAMVRARADLEALASETLRGAKEVAK